ncbi:MAG: histidine phosphatase family protein [Bifidobacteriaceae bacterium]|jgi:broad specificity phosphatase PhoE|nr:histidine phosphatase family protein [Bifidobacteriaceae bacterium]
MAETVFHFIRHGKVENPRNVMYERLPGFHLSGFGVQQVEVAAKFLNQLIINWPKVTGGIKTKKIVIYTSPLERTVETAQIIAAEFDISTDAIASDDRVIEAQSYLKGLTIRPRTFFTNDNWTKVLNPFKPSWGESYQDTAQRMVDFVFDKAREHPQTHVIVASHESPIYVMRRRFSGIHLWHHPGKRDTNNASILSMVFDDNANDVIRMGFYDPAAALLP